MRRSLLSLFASGISLGTAISALPACETAEEAGPVVRDDRRGAGAAGASGRTGASGRGGATGRGGGGGMGGRAGSAAATGSAGKAGASGEAGAGSAGGAGAGGLGGSAAGGGASGLGGSLGASAGAAGSSPLGACKDRPDGARCDGAVRVVCAAGAETARETCANGCAFVARSGQDVCLSDTTEPCFNDDDRAYCGGAIGSPFEQGSLFVCKGKRTASITACPAGCAFVAARGEDACLSNEVDPCFDDPANGFYCGEGIGGTPGTLYECRDKVTTGKTPCELGCEAMPFGTPDRCRAPASTCLDKPPGSFVRGFSACGNGGSHFGIDYGSNLGTQLAAGLAGTVVAVQTGYGNCPYNPSTGTCPSACINQFNYIKIRAEGGDPKNPANDLFVYYLHIDGLAAGIAPGAVVSKGQSIGTVGNSGCSSGPHVHLETVSVPKGGGAFLATCSSVDPASRLCP